MIDSIDHWATEYNLDGFRFDLMGLHDVETMNQIRKRLHVIDPTLTLIGEGWKMGHALSVDQRANQDQAEKMPGIAHFNDTIRDGIKGSSMEYDEKGFVNGDGLLAEDVKKGIVGGVNYEGDICLWGETEPCQSVSYTEAHDNHTIYDKIKFTNGTDDEEIVKKMHHMANAIVLTSQGVAFLHAGQEFMRTKDGVENSYKSPDHINWLDWELKERNMKSVEYVKGLINLRKQHPAFRLDSADLVRKHLKFTEAPDKVIAYSLKDNAKDDSWKEIFVAHNAAREPMNVKLPADGEWHVVVKGNQAGTEILDSIKGEEIHVDGLSTVIAYYK